MIWFETACRRIFARSVCLGLCLATLGGVSGPVLAAEEEPPQAWLVTYGPGEIYWQRFGHNAIWIRDPSLGLDHVFNFGFFDFAQRGFLSNFILGRLNYFAAARPAQEELAEYINENRSIRAQRLDLDGLQMVELVDNLLQSISAEHRDYLYDYYLNNCSTKVRDALDTALGAGFGGGLQSSPAAQNYRQHTRRLTGMDFWLYLGLQAGLASPIDREISRWDEAFIPGVLAEIVSESVNPESGQSLVLEDVMLYESTLPPPPQQATLIWHRYLAIPLSALMLSLIALRVFSGLSAGHLAISWLVAAGILGSVLAFLWVFTDHWVSKDNFNLLLLNPLWLLTLAPPLRRIGSWVLCVAGFVAVLAPWLPPGQYNTDVVAAILPLNLAAALVLFRRSGPEFRQ